MTKRRIKTTKIAELYGDDLARDKLLRVGNSIGVDSQTPEGLRIIFTKALNLFHWAIIQEQQGLAVGAAKDPKILKHTVKNILATEPLEMITPHNR